MRTVSIRGTSQVLEPIVKLRREQSGRSGKFGKQHMTRAGLMNLAKLGIQTARVVSRLMRMSKERRLAGKSNLRYPAFIMQAMPLLRPFIYWYIATLWALTVVAGASHHQNDAHIYRPAHPCSDQDQEA